MASLFNAYNSFLIRRPMLSSCVTATTLFCCGDLIAQQAVEKKGKNHDWVRTARLTFYGGALFGPAISTWYTLLNRLQFNSPVKAVIYRVWLDQAVLTPVAVAFFFGAMSTLEGKPHEAYERIQENYVPTLVRNWGVFVPTQIINFAFMPHHLRFPFVSFVSLFWNTYLSAVNARKQTSTVPQIQLGATPSDSLKIPTSGGKKS